MPRRRRSGALGGVGGGRLDGWRAVAGTDRRKPRLGRTGDFFLVHGNPLDDPSALWRVWRAS